MPSPSAASENAVVYCSGLCGALSLSLYVKHQTLLPQPGHVSHSVFHTLQSRPAVHWSVVSAYSRRQGNADHCSMQRTGLQPARYIEAAAYRTIRSGLDIMGGL